MRTKLFTLILVFSTSQFSFANNGKVTFAYPLEGIIIDGDFSDWDDLHMTPLSEGLPQNTSEIDFNAKFMVGYGLSEKALYFVVEIEDDDYILDKSKPWHQKDNLVLYFNPLHSERAATASMLILNEEGIDIEQPDASHQFLKEGNIEWKMRKKGKKRYYEGKVILGNNIKAFKSIGFDILIVDADEKANTKYVGWGKGHMKEYRSGQLGDVVLLSTENKSFGKVTGKIKWEQNIIDPLPSVVKIRSVKHSEFWIAIEVDSTGQFAMELPIGRYDIQSLYKIASPTDDKGTYNQSRIDDTSKKEFSITKNKNTDIGVFKISTFRLPTYIYEEEGVLHDFDTTTAQKVDNFISTICSYYNIPGASVALIKNGEMVYSNHFGVENLLTQKPVTESTLFQAASITKSVFAFIVLRLVEKRLIDLDKPLDEYLEFKNIEHNEHYKLITARIVLSHQSGLPNWALGGPGGFNSGQKTDLLFKPGTQYGYSGEAFAYLGRVVEKVTGKDLNQLLQEEVIEALGIPQMYLNDNGEITQARGHYADGRPTYYGMPYEPGVAHTLLTEASAFAKFVVALSNKKGLSDNMYQELEKRLALTTNFESPDNLYWNVGTSLGFFVQDTPFGTAIMHGGNNGDFQAEFVLYTEKKMGFVVFANSNTGHKLAQELGVYLMYGKK